MDTVKQVNHTKLFLTCIKIKLKKLRETCFSSKLIYLLQVGKYKATLKNHYTQNNSSNVE